MKECPKCGNTYTDDTLLFCLQDGARLRQRARERPETETFVRQKGSDEPPETETLPRGQLSDERPETETFVRDGLRDERPETETLVRRGRTDELPPTENLPVADDLPATLPSGHEPSKKAPIAIGAGVVAVIGIFVVPIATVLIWTVIRKIQQWDDSASKGKSPTPVVSPSPSVTPTPSPGPTEEMARREILSALYTWKRDMEAKDVISLANDYADKVDYYRVNGLSARDVLHDKMEIFSKYNSINIGIDNETVFVSDFDDTGSVECDKIWTFTGAETSTGNRRSQFKFRKIGGRWRITSEKDM